jgi:hypothetical protein
MSSPVQVDFSQMAINDEPEDFQDWITGEGAPARWKVVADETVAQGRAVAQVSTDQTDHRFPLAVYLPFSAKDVEVTVRFKPIAGTIDQAGGVAVRLRTSDDYYVAGANALEGNVRFYRVVRGESQQIATVDTKVAPMQWHTLTVRAQGDRFVIVFDDKELIKTTDRTFPRDGKVALWTKADSITYFDQLLIKPLE